VFIGLPLQIAANVWYRRTKSFILRVLLEEVVSILVGFATIQSWRGIWHALDIHLLPESFALSCWLTHILGMVLLFVTLSGSSNAGKGCTVSGDSDPFNGCLNDIEYFQYFFPHAAGRVVTTEGTNDSCDQREAEKHRDTNETLIRKKTETNGVIREDRVTEC
jgi:hypothetical protein